MKRRIKKVKNVLPLLNLDYKSVVYVKQLQDDSYYVPLGRGSVGNAIRHCGEHEIIRCEARSNMLWVYVK